MNLHKIFSTFFHNKKTIFLVICISSLSFSTAQTKRALVIGIGLQEDTSWSKINGDKDIPYVVEMLKNAGYKQISICKNEYATKAGIISLFKKLSLSCKKGDIVYVHFSGHGQQMKDLQKDEEDRLDECWIPYDAYRKPCKNDRGEKHLTDDEINVLLTNISNKVGEKGKLLVIIDACHSGDGTRGQEDVVRGVEDIFKAIKTYFTKAQKKAIVSNICPYKERWITLSACESNQMNIEMKKPEVGKLTYAIYTMVKNKELGNNAEWFKRLKMFVNMNTGSRPQRPVMSGEVTKFNISDMYR